LIILIVGLNAYAQKKQNIKDSIQADGSSVNNSTDTGIQIFKNQIQYIDLCQSIEKNIQEEKKSLIELKKDFTEALNLQSANEHSYNEYKIKLSSYTNILAMENIKVKELERTYIVTNAVIYEIEERAKVFKVQLNSVNKLLTQTFQRHEINKKQLSEISIEKNGDKLSVPEILVDNLETLTLILEDKLSILNKIREIYLEHAQNYSGLKRTYQEFKSRLQSYINEKRTRALFQRRTFDLERSVSHHIQIEFNTFVSKWNAFFSRHFWISYHNELWQEYGIVLYTSLIVFIFIWGILFQLKRLFQRLIIRYQSSDYYWCIFVFHLFTKSFIVIGTTILFILLEYLLYSPIIAVSFTKNVLIMWLFTQWILDTAQYLIKQNHTKFKISTPTYNKIFFFILSIRLTFIIYMIGYFSLDGSGLILNVLRIIFEIGLLATVFIAWRIYFTSNEKDLHNNRLRLIRFRILAISMNSIFCASLLIELTGFSELSIYWQLSWARFALVSLWSTLIFMLINELNQKMIPLESSENVQQNTRQTIKWTLIQISYLLWALITIISILLAWGVTVHTIINLCRVLNHPIPVGGMKISLPGFVYSFVILVFTHMLVKIWRSTLLKKMLANSGMAKGIQETISTITSYSIWVFGTILALNAIGISTTSLTVAFGALGIGLGFGLQNIFNNFISGLILLFERPIQVGDWVEINGIWGSVEKINVRSTVVKSVDNAALIIPNSEFISSRLTNWSFKDPKIRRTIAIGVAYGSDIHKVKEILLDIANKHPRVYRNPEPDVVFSDFGDSALMFVLRIWVHVDYSISTRTDIRFEIDRQFREHNIVIPFPQRDVHIYQNEDKT